MKKRIILAVVMIIACLIPANTVLASEGSEADAKSGSGSYIAVKIFDADVNDNGTLSNFRWSTKEIKNAVLKGLKEYQSGFALTGAQDVAEYLSTADTQALSCVARCISGISQENIVVSENVKLLSADSGTNLEEGYWVVFTQTASIRQGDAGTAPVYLVASTSAKEPVTITGKAVPPGWNYEIRDDDATWGKWADLQAGQPGSHRMTFAVPGNLGAFAGYYLQMNCRIPTGCTVDAGTAKVLAGGRDVTAQFDITCGAMAKSSIAQLSCECADITAAGILAGEEVVVTFEAFLDSGYAAGRSGNVFQAWAVYSSNPVDVTARTSTVCKNVYLYTYGMQIAKIDRETNEPIEGAVFTLMVFTPDDEGSAGKYVSADGTFAGEAAELKTDSNGLLEISGLDRGTYILTEAVPPEGFRCDTEDTVITISADYDEDGIAVQVGGTVSGNSDACLGTDRTADGVISGEGGVTDEGTLTVTVGNIKMIPLPVTGGSGVIPIVLLGASVIAVSLLTLIAVRKRKA